MDEHAGAGTGGGDDRVSAIGRGEVEESRRVPPVLVDPSSEVCVDEGAGECGYPRSIRRGCDFFKCLVRVEALGVAQLAN